MRATALLHGLKVLDLVQNRLPASFTYIKENTDASPATLSAILGQLCAAGYLDKKTGGYTVGHKVMQLAGSYLENNSLRETARTDLLALRDATDETAELIQYEEGAAVYIDKAESTRSIRLFARLGVRYTDLHVHAFGKAALAFMEEEKRTSYYKETTFTKHTPRTITSLDALKKEMKKVRQSKVAYDIRENRDDLIRIASPLFNMEGRLEGIICCAAPAFRTDEATVRQIAGQVKQAGEAVSRKLGYSASY